MTDINPWWSRLHPRQRREIIEEFVIESFKIESLAPTEEAYNAHDLFLGLPRITVFDLERLVATIAHGARLRTSPFLNVRVGTHVAPQGGPEIKEELEQILMRANMIEDPYSTHIAYETLHPFTDGNGRSGRALWAWQMLRTERASWLEMGFLHAWYYQSLEGARK